MKDLEPMTGENYDEHWDYIDYKNKVILDIGADYGSTASWFLKKGAKKIIAVEQDDNHFMQLLKNIDNVPEVEAYHLCVCQPSDFNHFIEMSKPDIVKMDIEGFERFMVDADPNIIKTVPEYIIETHSADIYCEIQTFLHKLGYEIKFCTHTDTVNYLGKDFSVDVLYARKK